MNSDLAAFRDALTTFSARLATNGDWAAASPCAGWSAGDVLDHVVDTQRDFLSTHGVEVGERPVGGPISVWQAHHALALSAIEDAAFGDREFDGFFGPITIGETLNRFYGFDLVVHAWDITKAWGSPVSLSDSEIASADAAADSFGEALHMEGICGPALTPPADSSPQTQLLAKLGRSA